MSDVLAILGAYVGVLVVTALMRQAELVLHARGYRRAAAAVATVRALVPDAPAAARRIAAMRSGRPPLPTIPDLGELPPWVPPTIDQSHTAPHQPEAPHEPTPKDPSP